MIERKYYLAKPNPVEAIRLTPDVVALIADTSDVAHELLLTGQALYQDEDDRIFQIRTGDYLVKTGTDAFIPIPPELFERAYDRLEQEPATSDRSCRECIHEWACVMQCGGNPMAPGNATHCACYENLRGSNAYFLGVIAGRKEAMQEGGESNG